MFSWEKFVAIKSNYMIFVSDNTLTFECFEYFIWENNYTV